MWNGPPRLCHLSAGNHSVILISSLTQEEPVTSVQDWSLHLVSQITVVPVVQKKLLQWTVWQFQSLTGHIREYVDKCIDTHMSVSVNEGARLEIYIGGKHE